MPETYHFHKDSAMTAIGNAIRTKNGLQTLYTEDDMAAAILAIPSGGSDDRLSTILTGQAVNLDISDLTITNLTTYAFRGNVLLRTISLPNTLTSIGERAFQSCTVLDNVVLPVSVTNIDTYAFAGCMNLKSISMPGVTNYKTQIFNGCGFVSFEVRSGVTTLARQTFQSCSDLLTAWIPNTVTTMGDSTYGPFSGCSHMTDLYCEATSKPSTWEDRYNRVSSSQSATVHWGVSKAEYEEIINS